MDICFEDLSALWGGYDLALFQIKLVAYRVKDLLGVQF